MRLNLNSTEESDIKEECIDGIKVRLNKIIRDAIRDGELKF